ncbi:MAG: alpha/beta hydrolase [Ilumatobacteraceae bacterium]
MGIETHVIGLEALDGVRLEADVFCPPGAAAAAVICHPHPLYGGERTNPVVDTVFRHLSSLGCAVLRFDFRGAGGSDGAHDSGTAERLDVAAAIDALARLTDAPLSLIGYSFGSSVALDVVHPRVERWVGIAPPFTEVPTSRLAGSDHRPKLLLVAQHDQFSPPDRLRVAVEGWANTTVEVVDSADHFLSGRLQHVADRVAAFVAP